MKKQLIPGRITKPEVLSKIPLMELVGQNRVLIENHLGVLAYSSNEIKVKVEYGRLCINGECLKLMQMSREQLVITGRIKHIQLFGRET